MKLDAALATTLSRWLDGTGIDRLELSGPEGSLVLGRAGLAQFGAPDAAATTDVAAPSLGVFLDRHPLHPDPVAAIGEEVAAGDPLGFLQVGALLTTVRAPSAGIVSERLAAPMELVGYGTPLLRLQALQPGDRP
jgi:acetyl-CoA carboxylase biotin carboxyl carrier protein